MPSPQQNIECTDGRLGALVSRLAGWSWDHPWWFLVAGLMLTILAGGYSASRLRFMTSRNDMISSTKPVQQRWKEHLDRVGSEDDMVVVASGSNQAEQDRFLAEVDAAFRAEPRYFNRVWREVDLRPIANRSMLLNDKNQIEVIVRELRTMRPLLDLPLGWNLFTLRNLVFETRHRLKALATEREEDRRRKAQDKPGAEIDGKVLAQLNHLLQAAAEELRGRQLGSTLWQPAGGADTREAMLLEPQRLRSDDGKLAFLLASPVPDASDPMCPQVAGVRRAREILGDLSARYPTLEVGLTGLPVLECDEMEASTRDSTRASWLAFLGVLTLYAWVFRQWRAPLASGLPLLAGTVWALGFATLAVGHLNLLSATFAVMLIGMGDYAVLLVSRFQRERDTLRDPSRMAARAALVRAAGATGPSILTAAVTGMLAFFATMLADFQAVAELGLIAGGGLLLCATSALTMAPPLLSVLVREAPAARGAVRLGVPEVRAGWARSWAARPGLALGIGLVVWLGLAAGCFWTRYDANLLRLQEDSLPSVQWEKRLLASTKGASWHALAWADTREQALEIKRRLEALPEVGRVTETASLLPGIAEQKAKDPLLAEIRERLVRLPEAGASLMHPRSTPQAIGAEVDQLAYQLVMPELADIPLKEQLLQSCAQLKAALATEVPAKAASALARLDDRMASELLTNLHKLRSVSQPGFITVADLPADFRERHMDAQGHFLLRVFAREELWDPAALARFNSAVASVVPDATGKPFTTLEGLEGMRLGFLRAGAWAFLAIALVLVIDLRNPRLVLLALAPLTGGLVAALGLMGWLGLALNPANLIALPLILGVGVDNGVHVIHDWLHREDTSRRYRLHPGTLQGILLAGLTTVLGFGTLAFSGHQGLGSLGLLLATGVAACMLCALALLPALLGGVRVPVVGTPKIELEKPARHMPQAA
ncbi:MAG: MMPL family transporter [Gemmataceae bacterium]